MNPQLHIQIGKVDLKPDGFKVPPEYTPSNKPKRTLWTSSYDPKTGSDWVRWCQSEQYHLPKEGWDCWLLTPMTEARVYLIDGMKARNRLVRDFLHDLDFEKYARSQYSDRYKDTFIDWERLSQEYDAVHMTEQGQWDTRMETGLYGWDCESTAWFRWAFKDVEYLGVHQFGLSEVDKDGA